MNEMNNNSTNVTPRGGWFGDSVINKNVPVDQVSRAPTVFSNRNHSVQLKHNPVFKTNNALYDTSSTVFKKVNKDDMLTTKSDMRNSLRDKGRNKAKYGSSKFVSYQF